MKNIALKRAEKSDAPLVFGLLQKLAIKLGRYDSFAGTLEGLEKHGFGSHPAFEAIIAYQQSTAVGYILYFQEFSTWRCSPGIYVQDLFVDADARGLGLGKRLIEAAAKRGKQLQATYLRLSVDTQNQSGRAFYQAIGFEHRQHEQMLMLDI